MLNLPFTPELPLTTERLQLRSFGPGDYEALFAFHSLPDSVRYVPFGPRTPESMQEVLTRKISSTVLREAGELLEFAVILGEGGLLIGDLLLALSSIDSQTIEVGYLFHPGYAGRGYATEAVRRLIDLCFGPLGAHRIIARIDSRNAKSIGVAERLGMRLEARLVDAFWFKGEWTTELDYALLARDWAFTDQNA